MKKRPARSSAATAAKQAVPRSPAAPRRLRPLAAIALGLIALAAGAWWFVHRGPAVPDVRRTADQNILLITLDTMRADGLSCYGGRAATPNLDRLAALGTRYDFAHAHAVMTLVSHASILTGLYPFQHGIHDNSGFRLPSTIPTLASLLRARGMATAAFIASFALDSRFGLDAGFDVYDERYGKSQAGSGFAMPERRGDAVVAAAVPWIERQHGRWFAWTHLFDPHAPYDPPSPFKERYADQPYYGEAAYTDSVIGRLLDAARDPSGRPTLVVVTGDHGEGLGDHGEMTHGLFAYESTLRIPLIVAQLDRNTPSWTAGAAVNTAVSGTVSPVAVSHVDIVPTILDALEMAVPSNLPGRSLIGRPRAAAEAGATYFEAMSASFNRGWAPMTGVLVDREKYIDLPLPERYDLAHDPGERSNLADRDPARQRDLEARLRAFAATGVASRKEEDPETQARLRALGYVSGNARPKAHYTAADDPKSLVALDQALRQAVDLYERKRLADAIPIYQDVIARRPSMEVTYTQLAMVYWDLGDPRSAITTLQRARQAGVDSVELRTKLGTYLAQSGNVREALPLLRETAAGDFPDLDAMNALGIALAGSGDRDQAIATFERILRLNPSNSMALENLATIALGEGQTDQARSLLDRALAVDPASPQAHNMLGVVEMKAGNRSAAIEHWKAAVMGDATNYDALYNLATALFDDGQRAAAGPYIEQFLRTAPPAFYAKDIGYLRRLLDK